LTEGTRRRGLGRERPLRRYSRPDRQLGPERPHQPTPGDGRESMAAAWTCRPPCFVVLHGWEWAGARPCRVAGPLPGYTIDGPQQTTAHSRRCVSSDEGSWMAVDGQLVARTVGELRATLPQEGDLLARLGRVVEATRTVVGGRWHRAHPGPRGRPAPMGGGVGCGDGAAGADPARLR
jgi:hypothetical protein